MQQQQPKEWCFVLQIQPQSLIFIPVSITLYYRSLWVNKGLVTYIISHRIHAVIINGIPTVQWCHVYKFDSNDDFFPASCSYNSLVSVYNTPEVTLLYCLILIDDFRVYSGVTLSIPNIAYICRNNKYYTQTRILVLTNTLFNANYVLTNVTLKLDGFVTRVGWEFYDLSMLYMPYSAG